MDYLSAGQETEISFTVFQSKTAFIKAQHVYPECVFLRKDHPKTEMFQCFQTACPANKNCAEGIAKRVSYLFDEVIPDSCEMLLAYFKEKDSIKATVFFKDLREPYNMVCNKSGIKKFLEEGEEYYWAPSSDYYLLTSNVDILEGRDIILND